MIFDNVSNFIRTVATVGVLTVACMAGATPGSAQSSIRVLVNGDPVTTYDIQARGRMLSVFSRGQQGESAAMEQLIDERLMLQEAERRGVVISDADVDAEFASRAAGANLSAAQFEAALRQAGVDPSTFRDFLRANTAWGEIVRARFRATVEITELDVAEAMMQQQSEGEGEGEAGATEVAYEYMLQPIIFVVPASGGAGMEGQRLSEANAFRNSFQGCENSVTQAGGLPGVVVRPILRREEGQLGGLAESIAALEVGGITEPRRVDDGFELLAVCAKNQIAGRTQAAEEVRSELSAERGDLLARRYLRDLRSDAVIEYR
jgi:peptidyl-prolyl cis-trans isomerase SurA